MLFFPGKATTHQTSNYGYHFPQDDPHCQVFHSLHHGSKTNIVLPISTKAGSAEHNIHIHNKKKQQTSWSQMLEASHLNKKHFFFQQKSYSQ